jgi:hypothetical protein
MLSLKALLVIASSVLAWGVAISWFIERRGKPYLFTISGDRVILVLARILTWSVAIGLGVIAWVTLSWMLPGIVALALFFGLEAGALDICGQRIRFVYVPRPAPASARRVYPESVKG